MKISATRRFEWDAAHRVLNHESKCATLHGHRYVALVTVEAERLDVLDRVIDFGVIKSIIGQWVDRVLDHTTILNSQDHTLIDAFGCAHQKEQHKDLLVIEGEPTAENLAAMIVTESQALLDHHRTEHPDQLPVKVVRVRLYETPNCYVDAVPE